MSIADEFLKDCGIEECEPTHSLRIFVPGTPQSKGSGSKVAGGRYIEDGTKLSRPRKTRWGKLITRTLIESRLGKVISTGVTVHAVFMYPIAKTRLKGKRAITPGDWHEQKPDGDKCLRAVYDPIKLSGMISDDCIISNGHHYKRWCLPGNEGAHILITW
jgi:Holliday junction resolvase RusA-like endonuclease